MPTTLKNLFSRRSRGDVILWLIATCVFVTALPVLAQTDPTETRVKAGLQELKDAILKAKETVARVGHREAQDFLSKAEELAKEAEAKYAHALTMNDNRLRGLLLKEALANIVLGKAYVERAVKLVLDFPLNRLRNTLQELMRRAEQVVLNSNHSEAKRLVFQARKTQLDAERAAMRDPLLAVTLYQRAITFATKAINLVEGRKPSDTNSGINRERERYENLKKRALEAIDANKNNAAQLVFEQAEKQARTAEDSFRKGEIAVAQQLYNGATRLLLRAIDLAMVGRKGQDYGRNEVMLLQDLIQTAEQETWENADPRAGLFLARARVLVREAEAAIERQQPAEAKWRIELARNFVDKAMRKVDRGAAKAENLAQRYNDALLELARDIEELNARAREANRPEATQLLELATNALKAAENAGRQNRLVMGFQLIRMAQHLLLRAETMLRDSSSGNAANMPTRETVLQRFAQIENALQEISTAGDAASCETVRAQALEMLKRSREALERGQLRLALINAEVANDMIENCARK